MSKIIIDNQADISDIEALDYVKYVISKGRISNDGKQYCYAARINDNVLVVTDLNKKSDRFVLTDC